MNVGFAPVAPAKEEGAGRFIFPLRFDKPVTARSAIQLQPGSEGSESLRTGAIVFGGAFSYLLNGRRVEVPEVAVHRVECEKVCGLQFDSPVWVMNFHGRSREERVRPWNHRRGEPVSQMDWWAHNVEEGWLFWSQLETPVRQYNLLYREAGSGLPKAHYHESGGDPDKVDEQLDFLSEAHGAVYTRRAVPVNVDRVPASVRFPGRLAHLFVPVRTGWWGEPRQYLYDPDYAQFDGKPSDDIQAELAAAIQGLQRPDETDRAVMGHSSPNDAMFARMLKA